jgi:hypothetical protein
MSEFNIKKLNVRSPYYITVSRKKDKVVDGEDCERDENGECIVDEGDDGTVSETKDNRKLICGTTSSLGLFAGSITYDISAVGRQSGTFGVVIANIITPIKYRIGKASSLASQSFQEAGLDEFATEWTNVGGTAGNLSSTQANPNGVSVNAQVSSSDENDIQLELNLPLIPDATDPDLTLTLSCPAVSTVSSSAGFVTIVSFHSMLPDPLFNYKNRFRATVKVNDTLIGGNGKTYTMTDSTIISNEDNSVLFTEVRNANNYSLTARGTTRRFVAASTTSGANGDGVSAYKRMRDANATTRMSQENKQFFSDSSFLGLQDFSNLKTTTLNRGTGTACSAQYKGDDFLNKTDYNKITVELPPDLSYNESFQDKMPFIITVTRHPKKNIVDSGDGVADGDYIQNTRSQSNGGFTGEPVQALICRGVLRGADSKLTFIFKGSNETELSFNDALSIEHAKIVHPQVEESGLFPDIDPESEASVEIKSLTT